jgi:hypothetical protein
VNPRRNVCTQLGLNLPRAVPTVAVSASMVFGGSQHPAAITYASGRRSGLRVAGLEFDAETELGLQPISDARPIPPATSATYKATWRTVPDQAIIERLKVAEIFWFEGGPTLPGSRRKRLYLDPNVGDRLQAELICRWAIEDAGGDPSDLEVSLPSTERIRLGVEAIRRFNREEAGSHVGPIESPDTADRRGLRPIRA